MVFRMYIIYAVIEQVFRLFNAWIGMLLIGVIHLHFVSEIPAIGYWGVFFISLAAAYVFPSTTNYWRTFKERYMNDK